MNSRQRIRIIVAREEGVIPPAPPFEGGGGDGSLKRDIPKNHTFDPKALKPLARMLFSSSVALGHAVTAYKEFARLKSSSISPDGMLGGKGYVLKVTDVRAKIQQACELLSAVTDTIHDEMNGPHWQPRLADLGENDAEDVTEFLDEAQEVLDDPERFGEKELDEIEGKNDGPGGTSNKRPDHGEGSKMPGAGDKETGSEAVPFGDAIKSPTNKQAAWGVLANSSLPVDTLPGGPRVDSLDRGEQTGPYGSFNKDEPLTEDAWGESEGVGNEYDYETPWSNEALDKAAGGLAWGQSSVPDGKGDGTETDANDFGIGYGAKGKGSEGYGVTAPDGRGVFGPSSGLPVDPGGKTRDHEEGSGPYLDGVERNVWAAYPMQPAAQGGSSVPRGMPPAQPLPPSSKLPFDGPDSVARSDYYEGDKGNLDNVNLHSGSPASSGLPGSGMPAKDTPSTPHPSHEGEMVGSKEAWRPATEAESQMPGESVTYNYDRDLMDVGQDFERQDVPYVKYDWTTHNYRNDLQDTFQHEDDRTGNQHG